MTLIPKPLKELREERLAQLADNAIEREQLKQFPAKLTGEERIRRSAIAGRLKEGEARVKDLEDAIDIEVAKHTDRKAVESRIASRKAVRTAHAMSAALHAEHDALETWRNESVSFFADRKRRGSANSAIVETAVKELTESDLSQSTRILEHALPSLRASDQGFFEALDRAIEDINHAARTGEERPSRKLFARASEQATRQLDARLPLIHAATDVDLGKNPELVEEPPVRDQWTDLIVRGGKKS